MRIGIIGAGALGIQIAHIAKQCDLSVTGFFDDTRNQGDYVEGIPVIGAIEDISHHYQNGTITHIVCAIGYKHLEYRENLFDHLHNNQNIPFATIIHPSCIIDSSVRIGEGCVLYAGCIIDKDVILGNNVLLNIGVCISHNSEIGSHSYLSPRATISGSVSISKKCFVGTNSTIIDNTTISEDIVVAAGTVVTKNLEKKGLYAGVPAIFKKETVNFK